MPKEVRKTIRFSQDEFEQIEKKLSEHNLTFSEFARSAILGKQVKTKLTQSYIFQLQKIGNNINQIAKSLNSRKSDISNSAVIEKLKEVLMEIKKYDFEISEK